jgi:6-phospho-beta-glucosidase
MGAQTQDRLKLAVLGGSSVSSPEIVRALRRRSSRPPVQIVLIGRSAGKLERVAAVCALLAERASPPIEISATTDLESGLEGAGYVLNQVRVGGYQSRAYDESFPQAFGIPGEETFGPGGMNNALRTIPVTLNHCQAIESISPDALLINLTNPSSYIQYAIDRYTKVNVIGVCDSPVGIVQAIAGLLGALPQDLWVGYIGMHHFGWVTEVRWKGRDAMPQVLERLPAYPGLPVDADFVRAVGAIPTSYFKYFYHPDRMLEKQRGRRTRAEQLLDMEAEILAGYENPATEGALSGLEKRGAHWYDSIVLPVLLAHAGDARSVFILNVRNGTTVPWMPPEAIVELPVVVARHGFQPLESPQAPPDLQATMRLNAACEMLWVEAVVERSYEKALRAMMLNHLVQNLDQARGILGEIWPGEE